MNAFQTKKRNNRYSGFTMAEILVTCVVMMTIMGFVTAMCAQTNMIWKDIGHRRIAVCELSNHLEALTQLSVAQATEAVTSLQSSRQCATTLRDPVIRGKVVTDNLGTRVELEIDWKRRFPGKPVRLVGWLVTHDSGLEEKE